MSLEIPPHWESQIEQIAQEQHIEVSQAVERVLEAGLDRLRPPQGNGESAPGRSYASFFGVARGRPGAHGSPEAADRYIEELRNAW